VREEPVLNSEEACERKAFWLGETLFSRRKLGLTGSLGKNPINFMLVKV